MNGGEIFLLALGPLLALSAGLIIYALGRYGPEHSRQVQDLAAGALDMLDKPRRK